MGKRDGYCTYFIQSCDGGNIKIGKAKDAEKRLRDLQCGSSELLRLLGTFPTKESENEFTARQQHSGGAL